MNRVSTLIAGIVAGLAVLSVSSPASAQATRTWVSGVGDDANPCSRTAPCKTWAGAISKTAVGGEIDVLDPGGFGQLTITKSLTIDGGGFIASGLVGSGSGIVVNASTTSVVVLRNIQIVSYPAATSATRGVYVTVNGAKSVTLHNVEINGITGCGVCIQPTTAPMKVVVANSRIINNTGDGVVVLPSTAGATGAANRVTVRNSTITGNGGAGIHAGPAATGYKAYAVAFSNLISDNNDGILSDGASARVHISDNDITGNNTGLRAINSGRIISFQNNRIDANNTDGVPTSTVNQQ